MFSVGIYNNLLDHKKNHIRQYFNIFINKIPNKNK